MFLLRKKMTCAKQSLLQSVFWEEKKEVLGRKHLLASIKAKFYSKVIKRENQMNNFAIGKMIPLQQTYKCTTIDRRKSDEQSIKNKFKIWNSHLPILIKIDKKKYKAMINQFILFFLIFLFSFILNIKAHTAGMISQRAPKLFVSLQCLTNLVRILIVKISFLSYSIPFYVAHLERKWNFTFEMVKKLLIKPSKFMILSTAFYVTK